MNINLSNMGGHNPAEMRASNRLMAAGEVCSGLSSEACTSNTNKDRERPAYAWMDELDDVYRRYCAFRT